jgi:hypothetical protein
MTDIDHLRAQIAEAERERAACEERAARAVVDALRIGERVYRLKAELFRAEQSDRPR